MDTRRLEAFSDGVFAVAITLLAFSLAIPALPAGDGTGGLAGALGDEWPSYAAFAISFLVIGIIWLNHHWVFAVARSVDGSLVLTNLSLLATVTTIPFATGLFARYLVGGGHNAHVAAAVYSAVMVAMSVAFLGLFLVVHGQAGTFATRAQRRRAAARFGSGLPVYIAACGISFVSAPATLALHGVMASFYAVIALGHLPQAATTSEPADPGRPLEVGGRGRQAPAAPVPPPGEAG